MSRMHERIAVFFFCIWLTVPCLKSHAANDITVQLNIEIDENEPTGIKVTQASNIDNSVTRGKTKDLKIDFTLNGPDYVLIEPLQKEYYCPRIIDINKNENHSRNETLNLIWHEAPTSTINIKNESDRQVEIFIDGGYILEGTRVSPNSDGSVISRTLYLDKPDNLKRRYAIKALNRTREINCNKIFVGETENITELTIRQSQIDSICIKPPVWYEITINNETDINFTASLNDSHVETVFGKYVIQLPDSSNTFTFSNPYYENIERIVIADPNKQKFELEPIYYNDLIPKRRNVTVEFQNRSGHKLSYYYRGRQISSPANLSISKLETSLHFEARPDETNCLPIIKKISIDGITEKLTIVFFPDDIVCPERNADIKINNLVKLPFSYSSTDCKITSTNDNTMTIKLDNDNNTINLTAEHRCFMPITKPIIIKPVPGGLMGEVTFTKDDLRVRKVPYKISISNLTIWNFDYDLEYERKRLAEDTLLVEAPVCIDIISVGIKTDYCKSTIVDVPIDTNTRTGRLVIEEKLLDCYWPIGIYAFRSNYYDDIYPKDFWGRSFAVDVSEQFIPQESQESITSNITNITIAGYNLKQFDILLGTRFCREIQDPYFWGKAIWNSSESVSIDFTGYYSANDTWYRQVQMQQASLGLNILYPFAFFDNQLFSFGLRSRFDFGNFKRYYNDSDIENVRYSPSIFLLHDYFGKVFKPSVMAGIVNEAFYGAIQCQYKNRIGLRYSFKGKTFDPPPQTRIEKALRHSISIFVNFGGSYESRLPVREY